MFGGNLCETSLARPLRKIQYARGATLERLVPSSLVHLRTRNCGVGIVQFLGNHRCSTVRGNGGQKLNHTGTHKGPFERSLALKHLNVMVVESGQIRRRRLGV